MSDAPSLVILEDDETPPRGLVSLNETPRRHQTLALPDAAGLALLQSYGEIIAQSKLYKNVTNWQSAVMLIRYGQQIGVDEHTALSDIYWIEGVPTASAKLMTALIERDHGGNWLLPVISTATECEVQFKRREWTEYQTARVTIDDYKHLATDARRLPWKNAPADMLWARLISRIARRFFASTIKGLYTQEEIDDTRAVETTGHVVDAPPAPAPARRASVRVTAVQNAPDVPDVPDAPNAPDVPDAPDPSPPLASRVRTPRTTPPTIIETWLGNIERATTQHRLNEIAGFLLNANLDGEPVLVQALAARSRAIAGPAS